MAHSNLHLLHLRPRPRLPRLLHRLVQDVGRLWQQDEPASSQLKQALGWINAACVGDPYDVRSWDVLVPLLPHAKAVAGCADQAGISAPTARLFSVVASVLDTQAAYGEAEPLMRRALAIAEASYGEDHPRVAIQLDNLAGLLQATNRLQEAEPM